jgi:hypothetical protein
MDQAQLLVSGTNAGETVCDHLTPVTFRTMIDNIHNNRVRRGLVDSWIRWWNSSGWVNMFSGPHY